MGLVKSLSIEIERSKSEEDIEDFLVPEEDVLDSPTNDDSIEDFITVEALHSSPDVHGVPRFDNYLDEEQ